VNKDKIHKYLHLCTAFLFAESETSSPFTAKPFTLHFHLWRSTAWLLRLKMQPRFFWVLMSADLTELCKVSYEPQTEVDAAPHMRGSVGVTLRFQQGLQTSSYTSRRRLK